MLYYNSEVRITHFLPGIICGALFFIVSVVHLVACYGRYPRLRSVTKVLLMPLLLAAYCCFGAPVRLLVVCALAFGWLGDVLLLFKRSSILMLCGICAFALGHIFYVGAMLSEKPGLHFSVLICLALCALWLTFVYKNLLPCAPRPLKKPGFLYALLLSLTCLTALYMLLVTSKIAWLVAFVGGLFFMVSDTMLTSQEYRKEMKHGNFYVMLTYIAAQALIITGFLLSGGM